MRDDNGAPNGPMVLDLTRFLAGPTRAQMSGDPGAEVVEIERSGTGDDTRGFAPPHRPNAAESACFLGVNRNEEAVALDIATPAGQTVVHRRLERSDVRLCGTPGQGALLGGPRSATDAARLGDRRLVTDTLTPVMRSRTTAEWVGVFEAAGGGCGPIDRPSQVFAGPRVQARGAVVEMDHASGERMEVIADPVRLSETPPRHGAAPPPLGRRTAAVLAPPGLDEAAIEAPHGRGAA